MTGLTARESQCLTAIQRMTRDGVPPSYDELREYMGLASKSGINRLITGLERRGRVRRTPGLARSIEIVGKTPPTPAELQLLNTGQLENLLGVVCGLLAHRVGVAMLRTWLDRIGNRLGGSR